MYAVYISHRAEEKSVVSFVPYNATVIAEVLPLCSYLSYINIQIFITFAKEVMFSPALVCLFVYNNITEKPIYWLTCS